MPNAKCFVTRTRRLRGCSAIVRGNRRDYRELQRAYERPLLRHCRLRHRRLFRGGLPHRRPLRRALLVALTAAFFAARFTDHRFRIDSASRSRPSSLRRLFGGRPGPRFVAEPGGLL